MTRFGADSLATVECVLSWNDRDDVHEEHFLARRINSWRDIFPPGMSEALNGAAEGDLVSLDLAPGTAIEAHRPEKTAVLPLARFRPPNVAGRAIPPSVGRFYPQGLLQGLPHVYPQTTVPFRLLAMDDETVTVDRNHPLAGRNLHLDMLVQRVEAKRGDTGGRLTHWTEEICNFGPGMQARLPGQPPAPESGPFFARTDETVDTAFYAQPRMISHVDRQASDNLRRMYGRFLEPGMRVLDIMSSVDSHLPEGMDLDVTGLGLNRAELEANPRLNRWAEHDLNAVPAVPENVLAQAPFDAAVCSLSVEYLTRPVDVLRSIRETLAPQGVALVGLSDRWFPTKAVAGWMDLHPFERSSLVLRWMRQAGFEGAGGTVSMRNDWRPHDDRHFVATRGVSDPVFLVWARS